jgi:signal transduction histidine kinase
MRNVAVMTRWLAFGMAILFVGTAVGLASFLHSRFEKLNQQPIQGAVNIGSQLRIEFMSFRFRLLQAMLTRQEADLSRAAEGYDILLSRLQMIESKAAFRLPRNDRKLLETFQKLSAEIKSWEPIVAEFAAGDVAMGGRLTERVDQNALEFALLSTLINDFAYVWFVRNADSLDGFFIIFAAFTLASLAVMGLLLRYLFVSVRTAETAFAELGEAHQALSAAKNEAESSDRVKSQFLANVSHELRTPLNAIIGFSEMMLDKNLAARSLAKREEYLGYVLNSGRHLLSLINDILDFSKIQQGHWPLKIEPVDLRAELGEILRIMSPQASARRVRLIERIDVEPPPFATDLRSLRQILMNLLSNAVKFSPPEGRVEIAMRAGDAGEIVVEIDDEGPGIDQDFMKRIGAPFSQARSAALSGEAGTGLGLAITKDLIARIGGAFAIANRPTGGARATVILRTSAALTEDLLVKERIQVREVS